MPINTSLLLHKVQALISRAQFVTNWHIVCIKMFQVLLLVLGGLIIQGMLVEEDLPSTSTNNYKVSPNISDFQLTPRIIFKNTPDAIETTVSNFDDQLPNSSRDTTIDRVIESLFLLQTGIVMILIDDTKETRRTTEIYMKDILALSNLHIQFLLMTYNSTGVSNLLSNSTNQRRFFDDLEWKEPEKTFQSIAPESLNGGVTFFAILRAIRQLPGNSAIIVFTDSRINDPELSRLALRELIENDIILFVVWNGVYPTLNNEEKLITEHAVLTGGRFYVTDPKHCLSELYNKFYFQLPEANLTKEVVAFSNNITIKKSLHFPIDPSVTEIHISATVPIVTLQLITPTDQKINILNNTDVEQFCKGSFSVYEKNYNQYETHLYVKNGLASNIVGIWRLDVDPGTENAQGSNVTVSVQSQVNVTTKITYKFNSDDTLVKILKVTVTGKNSHIKNITLFDTFGLPMKNDFSFATINKRKNSATSAELIDEETAREVDIPIEKLPKEKFYLKVIGEDQKGQNFSRVTYFDGEKITYFVKPLTIDVSPGSELITNLGSHGLIYFEITNNRDRVMFVQFLVQDEKSLLRNLQPRTSWINPKQTVVVKVITLAPYSVPSGFRNVITLTATGPEQAQKQAVMYVTANGISDKRPPRLRHKYTSDCTNLLIGNCKDGTWVIEVTAEDRDSGLLTLTSIPKGLFFPNPYIAGTKQPVIGIFGGSCCEPKLQLMAIDAANNRRVYNVDAYRTTLGAGSISAIVLGSFLFVILIVCIGYIIYRCRKERKSMDVSVFHDTRTNATTSRL